MNITLVYWGGLYNQAGLLVRQMADQNLKVTFFAGDGIVSNKLSSLAGDTIAGTLFTFSLNQVTILRTDNLPKNFGR